MRLEKAFGSRLKPLGQKLKAELAELLRAGRTAMTWPVWVELHQGAKGKREEENLKGWREVSHWLEFDDDCWAEAAKTVRAGLRTGVNVPFGDVLAGPFRLSPGKAGVSLRDDGQGKKEAGGETKNLGGWRAGGGFLDEPHFEGGRAFSRRAGPGRNEPAWRLRLPELRLAGSRS